MKLLTVILFWSYVTSCECQQIGFGTCIAFTVNRSAMVLGADSKITGNKVHKKEPKIVCHRDFFAATAGLRFDTVIHYHCDSVVKWVADHYAGFDNRLAHLKDTLSKLFKRRFSVWDQKYSGYFTDKSIIDMLVWESEQGVLRFSRDQYKPFRNVEGWDIGIENLETEAVLSPDRPSSYGVLGFGDTALKVLKVINSGMNGWRQIANDKLFAVDGDHFFDLSSAQSWMYYAVYCETIKHSDSVGKPIIAVIKPILQPERWHYINEWNCHCTQ